MKKTHLPQILGDRYGVVRSVLCLPSLDRTFGRWKAAHTNTVKGPMRLFGRSYDWTQKGRWRFQPCRFLQKYNHAVHCKNVTTWFFTKVQPRGFSEHHYCRLRQKYNLTRSCHRAILLVLTEVQSCVVGMFHTPVSLPLLSSLLSKVLFRPRFSSEPRFPSVT